MNLITRTQAEEYLTRHGIGTSITVKQILDGFDFTRPVYLQRIDSGNVLYQFLRNPGFSNPVSMRGNWYCLSGATRGGLAISDGVSGRHLQAFDVLLPFIALEGTASRQSLNWDWAGGGPGGATQLFVPQNYAGYICPRATSVT